MPTIEDSIVVDRPPQEVFAFVQDPENIALVNSNLVEFEQVGDEARGKGTRDRGVVKVAGKRIEFVQEITEWEPGRRMAMRSVEAPMRLSWTLEYHFEEADAGRTRVRFRQETPSLGKFWGRLGDDLVLKMYGKDVHANLENLKAALEEG